MTIWFLTLFVKMTSSIVEHCVFKWKIQNFSLSRRESSSRIFSPYFKLSPESATEWYLDLHLNMKIKREKGIFLDLVRCKHDEGPESVGVSFRVQFSYLNVLSYEESNKFYFRKDEKFRFSKISTLKDVLACKRDGADDCVVFICEMVTFSESLKEIKDIKTYCLQDLSKSMETLVCSDKWTDTVLQLDGGEYSVHKAILSARSGEFKKMFEGEIESVLSLKGVPQETMRQLLYYIYTGKKSKNNFIPIGLFECAQRFHLSELEGDLFPIKISAESCVEVENCHLKWNIERFSSWKNIDGKYLDSQQFGSSFNNLLWTARLSKNFADLKTARKLQKSPNSYAFSVQCHSEIVCHLASVEVSFSNGKEIFFSAEEVIIVTPRKKIYFVTLVDKNLLYNKLLSTFGDMLKITCKIRLSTGKLTKSFYKTVVTSKVSLSQSTKTLSNDLMNLLESGIFSDFAFVTKDKEYKVHKCILFARCPTFEGLVDKNTTKKLDFGDVESEVMDTFLRYIYSGIIDIKDIKVILKLWLLAKKFGVHTLKKICYKSFRLNLELDNICDAIILIDLLKIKLVFRIPVRKFIATNWSEITTSENWKKLQEENSNLSLEFYP